MIVRPATADDAAAIAAIYAPHVLAGTASFETQAPDAAEIARRMMAGGGLYPWLACTDGDRLLAYAYAGPHQSRAAYRWTVETTVYVAEAEQRRGAGRRLYAALLDTLTAQGFTQAMARIALPNPGSAALHERLGFTGVGVERAVGWKQDRWVDVGLWQRPLAAPGHPPAVPQGVADLRPVSGERA